jgi:hypothetical protein
MTDMTMTAGASAIAVPARRRRFRPRHLWLVPGLAIAVSANMLGEQHGVGILALIAFGIAPDMPRLFRRFGAVPGSPAGALGTPLFNLAHHPLVAFATFAVAAAGAVNGIIPIVVLVATRVWSGHIVIGWAVGDVPRSDPARKPEPRS